ncbi:hypothetical protein RHSP_57757 [Rhizobium freirei PRF 81]|uniref:Uncharacterized protein n=1 Tax=Rhizobium freirei PRF 81 TaxID=363754 RepID=N6UWB0_9HYPH|nr:hypothetical protein RHSP_57757 [Rhizobium freirei PRF 81]
MHPIDRHTGGCHALAEPPNDGLKVLPGQRRLRQPLCHLVEKNIGNSRMSSHYPRGLSLQLSTRRPTLHRRPIPELPLQCLRPSWVG